MASIHNEIQEQARINQEEWERPENWSVWGIYRSARDNRLWVSKCNAMGWTVNFAHRGSWWTLFGLFSVPLGLVVLVAWWSAFR
jgi:uncharacterized membrane protein